MRLVMISEIRLLAESVAHSLMTRDGSLDIAVSATIADMRERILNGAQFDVAIIDTTQGLDLDAVRVFHHQYPDLALLALGLKEQEQAIVAHGSAGFGCYVRREDGIERLYTTLCDASAGRLTCPPEIAGFIMRALFRGGTTAHSEARGSWKSSLTLREEEVARHVADALSNKEIAILLGLSESTVKHHVHSILGKLDLSTRRQLMRRMRLLSPQIEPALLAS